MGKPENGGQEPSTNWNDRIEFIILNNGNREGRSIWYTAIMS